MVVGIAECKGRGVLRVWREAKGRRSVVRCMHLAWWHEGCLVVRVQAYSTGAHAMRFIVKTVPTYSGFQSHLASFERYAMGIKSLPLLADSYDAPVELWDNVANVVLARYMNGSVVYENGAAQIA